MIDPAEYANPTGEPIFDRLPPEAWQTYLDFGCGCGRSARRLIQQNPRPQHYIGVDLHRGMVQWCQRNLGPFADGFEFIHHDVYNPGLNPNPLRPWIERLPVEDATCTMIEATSVFTHLVEGQTEFYLDEVGRVLAADGHVMATWFLFDKAEYPYMQENQNALYINDRDTDQRRRLRPILAAGGVGRAGPRDSRLRHLRSGAFSGSLKSCLPGQEFSGSRSPTTLRRSGVDRRRCYALALTDSVLRAFNTRLRPFCGHDRIHRHATPWRLNLAGQKNTSLLWRLN